MIASLAASLLGFCSFDWMDRGSEDHGTKVVCGADSGQVNKEDGTGRTHEPVMGDKTPCALQTCCMFRRNGANEASRDARSASAFV